MLLVRVEDGWRRKWPQEVTESAQMALDSKQVIMNCEERFVLHLRIHLIHTSSVGENGEEGARRCHVRQERILSGRWKIGAPSISIGFLLHKSRRNISKPKGTGYTIKSSHKMGMEG